LSSGRLIVGTPSSIHIDTGVHWR